TAPERWRSASRRCRLNRALPPAPERGRGLSETKGLLALRIFAESWVLLLGRGVRRACLDRVGIGFAGTDADGLLQIDDEDLAVADLAGVGRLGDRLDHSIELVVGNRHVDLHLRQKVDDVLGTAIQLGVSLLSTEAFDFGDGDALYADFRQRLAYVVQLERLDDGSD